MTLILALMDSVTEVIVVTPVSVMKDTQELIVMVGLFVNIK